MPSHSDDSAICDSCRKIDFALLSQQALMRKDWSSIVSLVHSEQCELCAILTPNRPVGEKAKLHAFPYNHDSEWVSEAAADIHQTVALSISSGPEDSDDWQDDCPEDSDDWQDDYYVNIVFCVPQSHPDTENVLWKPRPLMSTPDYETAREWLGNCQEQHSLACDHSSPPRIQGLHLIDVQESKIVVVEDSSDYHWLALSCASIPL